MYICVYLQDDIALGAVVGSAVFNVMLVPGLCAVYATTVSDLTCVSLEIDEIVHMVFYSKVQITCTSRKN